MLVSVEMQWSNSFRKKVFILSIALLLLGGVFYLFVSKKVKSWSQISFPLVQYWDLMSWMYLTKVATWVPEQTITVNAEVNGKVERIFVQDGEILDGGQPLIKILDLDNLYALEVENAKKTLDQALQAKDQLLENWIEQRELFQKKLQEQQDRFLQLQSLLESSLQNWVSDMQGILDELQAQEQALKTTKLELSHIDQEQESIYAELDLKISNAKIKYEAALHKYAQLTIRSPMRWKVDALLIQEGEILADWTPVLRVKWLKEQPEMFLDLDEYLVINQELPLQLIWEGMVITGMISEVQKIDENPALLKAKIVLAWDGMNDRDFIKVHLPLLRSSNLIPLKHLKLTNSNHAEIPLLSWGNVVYKSLDIEKRIWNFAKIKESLSSDFSFFLMDFSMENELILKWEKK